MTGISKKEFLRRYSANLLDGSAALFIGAGISRPAGFADWRELLKVIADDLQIDIVREHDLIAVAQFEANRKGNKDSLNEAIIRHFDRDGKLTPNHELIARLPVDTIWTTNYDKLLERAYARANKKCDVKHTASQLTSRKSHCDVVLFKMHGDVDDPQNAILTKDDYECYETEHGAFTVQLLADLISKRFLFLGFSFTDPNIDYTFNRLRRLLNPRKSVGGKEHYCILRKPHRDDYTKLGNLAVEQERLFKADCARFDHRVQDMTRFGIQSVVIERYEEITELLASLHQQVSTRTVMISGAAHDSSPLGQNRLDSLCEELGRRLIEDGYDIVSGVGKGIGAAMMVGAHKALARPDASRLAQRLKLFPFPYWHPVISERTSYYETNRKEMAAQAGVSIFIAGNKEDDGKVIESPGVDAEFKEALKNHHFIIPIGATGYAAKTIWTKVVANPKEFFKDCDVSAELKAMGESSSSNDELLSAVFSILNKIRHNSP